MEYKVLNNGVRMPMLGFGVFQIPDADVCFNAVSEALKADYRLIDTASVYSNEEAVGQAIRKSGLSRDDLFVTTKAWIPEMGYENTLSAFEKSLMRLGLEMLKDYSIKINQL